MSSLEKGIDHYDGQLNIGIKFEKPINKLSVINF